MAISDTNKPHMLRSPDLIDLLVTALIVDEDNPRCGMATDLAALVATKAFDQLDAPPQMVTPPHTPVPYSRDLESLYVPDAARVVAAAKQTLS